MAKITRKIQFKISQALYKELENHGEIKKGFSFVLYNDTHYWDNETKTWQLDTRYATRYSWDEAWEKIEKLTKDWDPAYLGRVGVEVTTYDRIEI